MRILGGQRQGLNLVSILSCGRPSAAENKKEEVHIEN